MNFQIRVLEKVDGLAYQALRLYSFKEAPYAFSESYEDEQLRSLESFEQELHIDGEPLNKFALGAFNAQQNLIGFARFRRDQRSKAQHKSMVFGMYVHPEYRKLGVGKALLLHLIEHAKSLDGLEQIHLWALKSTYSDASKFYAKLGFRTQGTVEKDLLINGNYVDAEYLVLYFE